MSVASIESKLLSGCQDSKITFIMSSVIQIVLNSVTCICTYDRLVSHRHNDFSNSLELNANVLAIRFENRVGTVRK